MLGLRDCFMSNGKELRSLWLKSSHLDTFTKRPSVNNYITIMLPMNLKNKSPLSSCYGDSFAPLKGTGAGSCPVLP